MGYYDCFRAYDQLKVPHEPLSLITPQFETPLPPLQPAVSYYFQLLMYVAPINLLMKQKVILMMVYMSIRQLLIQSTYYECKGS